jgi:hypothetical protein
MGTLGRCFRAVIDPQLLSTRLATSPARAADGVWSVAFTEPLILAVVVRFARPVAFDSNPVAYSN